MGLVEPNIANHAYYGEKVFESNGPQTNLRVITNLYSNVIVIIGIFAIKRMVLLPAQVMNTVSVSWNTLFCIYNLQKTA